MQFMTNPHHPSRKIAKNRSKLQERRRLVARVLIKAIRNIRTKDLLKL